MDAVTNNEPLGPAYFALMSNDSMDLMTCSNTLSLHDFLL